MVKFVKSFVMDESGASAAEYALILAIVGSAIAAAAIGLSGAIGTALSDAKTCISSNGSTCN
jgi:pilus assembly protein Flp/PilA